MIGERIFLRAPEPADIDVLYKWENDPEIWHLGNSVEPFSRFTLEQYILSADRDIFSAKQLRLIIADKQNENPLGSIDLFDFDPVNHRAGIGILISSDERGKGYATEALQLLIDYAFSTLELHQLFCNIATDNKASLELFQKFKFTISGTKKEWLRRGTIYIDEHLLQLLNH